MLDAHDAIDWNNTSHQKIIFSLEVKVGKNAMHLNFLS